ncbi:hypothetical protein ACS0TY_029506 [Phlomoides rotata]
MLDNSAFLENNSFGSASDTAAVGGGCEGEGNYSGGERNRWPREETMALLKIRSDMDLAFRDSTLKAPLWDEVSRKLGELGYNRSAKKCKEKFENIYKYHKRTKDGRSNRHNGKNYRFFEQLELFNTHYSVPSTPLDQIPFSSMETTPVPTSTPTPKPQEFTLPCSTNAEVMCFSTSTASSESEGSVKKKRKLANYLEKLMKDVLKKQEDLQNKFLEAIEKSEKDRIAREEAWKVQERARIKREQELLAKERAFAAAKDAAMLAFLQKITQQTPSLDVPEILTPFLSKLSDKQEHVLERYSQMLENDGGETSTQIEKQDNSGGENSTIQMSSSRWPKAEIEALIMLKTELDLKYQDSGPKGPLWEEVSTCMKKIGYERSAKRCKEKWENINKYYKRVKESKRKRPEDSKTCPYFSMLESLYANKSKKPLLQHDSDNGGGGCNLKPEQILMQMMGQTQQQESQQVLGDYGDSDHQNQEEEEDEDDEDAEEDDGYQIVANHMA